MGESDRYNDYRRQRRKIYFGDDNNAVVNLFAINVILFLILLTIQVIYLFVQKEKGSFEMQVIPYFAMPAKLAILSHRPWTILIYMFSDISVMRLFSNMLWLWAFGYILQDISGNKKIIPIYIYGGLFGALFFILANNFLPALKPMLDQSSPLLGANAATMAVAVATTTLAPDYRFFRQLNGGIAIWVLTLIYILIDFAGVAGMGAAYSLSHLGGALAGFLFVILLHKGIDASAWMNNLYNWFMGLFTPASIHSKSSVSVREKVFYNTDNRLPYKKTANITQQRVDEILDKINQKGYRFLTDEEKNILKRASEEDLS